VCLESLLKYELNRINKKFGHCGQPCGSCTAHEAQVSKLDIVQWASCVLESIKIYRVLIAIYIYIYIYIVCVWVYVYVCVCVCVCQMFISYCGRQRLSSCVNQGCCDNVRSTSKYLDHGDINNIFCSSQWVWFNKQLSNPNFETRLRFRQGRLYSCEVTLECFHITVIGVEKK